MCPKDCCFQLYALHLREKQDNQRIMKNQSDFLDKILFFVEKLQKEDRWKSKVGNSLLYWEIGRLISQEINNKKAMLARREIIKDLSCELVKRYGEGFGYEQLLQMELFFVDFPDIEIMSDLSKGLTWDHFREWLLLDDKPHCDYFAEMCKK